MSNWPHSRRNSFSGSNSRIMYTSPCSGRTRRTAAAGLVENLEQRAARRRMKQDAVPVVLDGVAAAAGQQFGRRPRAIRRRHQLHDLLPPSDRVADDPRADLAQFQLLGPLQRHVDLIVRMAFQQPLPVGVGAFQRAVRTGSR